MKRFLLLYLFLEVIISTFYIQAVGGWFIIQTILGFFFGICLIKARFAKLITALKLCKQLNNDLSLLLKENLSTMLVAVLFIMPGVLTDLVGLLLQMKSTTQLFFTLKGRNTNYQGKTRSKNEEVIIDYNDNVADCTKS